MSDELAAGQLWLLAKLHINNVGERRLRGIRDWRGLAYP